MLDKSYYKGSMTQITFRALYKKVCQSLQNLGLEKFGCTLDATVTHCLPSIATRVPFFAFLRANRNSTPRFTISGGYLSCLDQQVSVFQQLEI